MTTLWDTDGAAIARALRSERALAGGLGGQPSLTLIAVCHEAEAESVRSDGAGASGTHPCRLLTVVRRNPDAPESRIDAEIGFGGQYGPVESVVVRITGPATAHADSVVLPLLAAESSVHLMYLQPPPRRLAEDPLAPLCVRRTTDCSLADDPRLALDARAEDYRPGDTDLSWTRLTDLRGLLATTLDGCSCEPVSGSVRAAGGEPSGRLLRGWLASRLGIPVTAPSDSASASDASPGTSSGPAGTSSGTSSSSGIAGTSVTAVELDMADGSTVTLSQGPDHRVTVRIGERTREVAVVPRARAELLAEELRRAEVDVTYEAALSHAAASSTPDDPAGAGGQASEGTHA